jgi:hypothetical protein
MFRRTCRLRIRGGPNWTQYEPRRRDRGAVHGPRIASIGSLSTLRRPAWRGAPTSRACRDRAPHLDGPINSAVERAAGARLPLCPEGVGVGKLHLEGIAPCLAVQRIPPRIRARPYRLAAWAG